MEPYIYMLSQNNPKVTELTIADLRKNPGDFKALVKAVEGNTVLRYLSISMKNPTDSECKDIGDMLMANKSITEFCFTKSRMSLEGLKFILDAVQENENITSLDISGNALGHNCGPLIGYMLTKNDHLKSLNISKNMLNYNALIDIVAAIVKNPILESLDISESTLKKKGSKLISILLAHQTSIEYLNISHCLIYPRDAKRIAKGLRKNNTLKILDISINPFTQVEAALILKSLHNNTSLVSLCMNRFWQGHVVATGGLFLGEAVRDLLLVNDTLKELYIENNSLYAGTFMEIAEGLKGNTTLTHLYAGRNYPETLNQKEDTVDGILALADVIKTNTTLECLSLSDCTLSEESIQELASAMEQNETLLVFEFQPDYHDDAASNDDGVSIDDAVTFIDEKLRKNQISKTLKTTSIYQILLNILNDNA